jgi:hypothetical protein
MSEERIMMLVNDEDIDLGLSTGGGCSVMSVASSVMYVEARKNGTGDIYYIIFAQIFKINDIS